MSSSFFRFLEEQNRKAGTSWQNVNTEGNNVDKEPGKLNGRASAVQADPVSKKYREDTESEVSLKSLLRTSPFQSADVEDEEELVLRAPSWHQEEESSRPNNRVGQSAQELFRECFGKWKNASYPQGVHGDHDTVAKEVLCSRKLDKSPAFGAAFAKRELAEKHEDLSIRKLANSPSPPPPPRRNSAAEMFMVRGEGSPLKSQRKQETKIKARMDFLGDGSLMRWEFKSVAGTFPVQTGIYWIIRYVFDLY